MERDLRLGMIPVMARGPMTFDEFEPGQAFESGPRTISRADIDAFAALSGDRTALHTDEAYARTTPFGGLVAHGALVLSVATGLAFDLGIFEGSVLALRSMEIAFERPVYPEDILKLDLRVKSKEPQPRPDRGRVTFAVGLTNQHGRSALSASWVLLLRRSPEMDNPAHPSRSDSPPPV